MTREEFSAALDIARSDRDLSEFDDAVLFGYGLPDFKPVGVIIEVAAKTIRWQCVCLNGAIDSEELERTRRLFRKRVLIV